MSGSSNLNSFPDRRQVAAQLVSCGVLPPGLVQGLYVNAHKTEYMCYDQTGDMLYSHMPYHNGTIIKTQEDFFINICTSHFIVRVRKGLLKVCVWEGAGDRTETAIFWPHFYGRQRCVFLVLLMLNWRPWGPALCWMMAFFTESYQQLLWAPTQLGAPSPFGLVWLSLPHPAYNSVRSLIVTATLTSVLTELYNSSTSTQSPTRSLEWHDWSSSSGNNCHAVQRSLSSGASIYECTMGIFLPRPISSANFRPCDFLS